MPRRRKRTESHEQQGTSFDPHAAAHERVGREAEARPIGGMVEKKWNGKRMWQCPRCNATTFDEGQSRVHTCKRVKFADEETAAE